MEFPQRQLNADHFAVSPDRRFVLLGADNDTTADAARYSIYELSNHNIFPLSHQDRALRAPLLQHVLWAPSRPDEATGAGGDGQQQQGIAFVHENDVYYKPRVEHDLVCRVTVSGIAGRVYNGRLDWFYSNTEELRSDAMMFSADGGYLAYMEFNDTAVDTYE